MASAESNVQPATLLSIDHASRSAGGQPPWRERVGGTPSEASSSLWPAAGPSGCLRAAPEGPSRAREGRSIIGVQVTFPPNLADPPRVPLAHFGDFGANWICRIWRINSIKMWSYDEFGNMPCKFGNMTGEIWPKKLNHDKDLINFMTPPKRPLDQRTTAVPPFECFTLNSFICINIL